METSSTQLPLTLSYTSAVSDGNLIYLFGGHTPGEILTTIFIFDPETGSVTNANVELPMPIKVHTSIWTVDEAYIFGGIGYDGEPLPHVVRFKPPGEIEFLNNSLPYGVKGGSLVWDGKYIYHFGNCVGTGKCGHENIIRFDPLTNLCLILNDTLPGPRSGTSAVWYNGSAYIFGAKTGIGVVGMSAEISKFTPGQNCEIMNAQLPGPRFRTSASIDGNHAYIYGGYGPDGFIDEIIKYDLKNDTTEIMPTKLPTPRATRAGAKTGECYFLFGGDAQESELDEILVFDFKLDVKKDSNKNNEYEITELQIGVIVIIILLPILLIYFSKRSRK